MADRKFDVKLPRGLDPDQADRMLAGIGFIGRTGAAGFQIRFHDDEMPIVWIALALYPDGKAEAAAAIHPTKAVLRLCESLGDGGTCAHCMRPAGFIPGPPDIAPDMPGICWVRYNSKSKEYERSCGVDG